MKIVKKITAVLLLSVVLISAIVIPSFAWEWNSTNRYYYAEPVFDCLYAGVGRNPWTSSELVTNSATGNWFTTNGAFNLLFNPNSQYGEENMIVNFPFTEGDTTITPQGDSTSKLGAMSLQSVYGSNENVTVQNVKNAFLKYAGTFVDDTSPYASTATNITPISEYLQFAGAYAPNVIRSDYVYNDGTTRYFAFVYDDTYTYDEFLPSSISYRFYIDGSLNARPTYKQLFDVSGLLSYRLKDGSTRKVYLEDLDDYNLDYGNFDNYYSVSFPLSAIIANEVRQDTDYDSTYPIRITNLQVSTIGACKGVHAFRLAGVYRNDPLDDGAIEAPYRSSSAISTAVFYDGDIPYPVEISNVGDFLATALGGFFEFSLIPGITLGGLFATVLGVVLLIWLLKMFAGG